MVGTLWAEICLTCKRHRQHRLVDFPRRYERITFEKCITTDGNRAAIEAAKAWCLSGESNLWLYGAPGTGKTHIAAAAMWEGPIGSCQFVNVAEMLLEFQASVKEHDELSTIKKFYSPGILFDDVASHRVSDFGIEMFYLLLERFYGNQVGRLIFTSNLTPKEILNLMGERVASRLKGLASPIRVEGPDRRLGS